jgi:hypothetical protein
MNAMSPVLCLVAALAASACASTARLRREGASEAPLNGMVYDYENRPVPDAEIRLGGLLRARSDINGRFSLGELPFGAYKLELRKKGYERAALALEYRDPTQILYLKTYSAKQLLLMAEKEAERRSWADALAILDRIEALGPADPAARYLRAVLLFRRGDVRGSQLILEALLTGGYDEPYVRLFLADLCQYRLGDPLGAVAHLEKYLKARYDPEVEARLRELREKSAK